MRAAIIKLSYRQIIDISTPGQFEQDVFKASYEQFLSRSHAYNPEEKFQTFKQIVANDGRANALNYQCGMAVLPYVDMLDNNIPTLADNSGKAIKFGAHQFDIIDSDVNNISGHKVKITYITETITALDHVEDYMLLAYGNKSTELSGMSDKCIEDTFMLQIVPRLSVYCYMAIRGIPAISLM